MHPYATDSNERKLIPGLTAIFGVVAALALGWILTNTSLSLPWWFDAPAVVGFYGIFYSVFDRLLWKHAIFRKVGLVKLPNLNGTWRGHAVSSFDQHGEEHDATLTIRQNWSEISVAGKFGKSNSRSLVASVFIDDAHGIVLSYEYISEPFSDTKETMEIHHGFARLIIKSDGKEINGEYYTGRGRRNIGRLKLERE